MKNKFCLLFLMNILLSPVRAETIPLSVPLNGIQSNGDSFLTRSAFSEEGRYLVFYSNATNLIAHDMNGYYDIFIVDRWLRQIQCLSTQTSGELGNGDSLTPAISANGRYVVFSSYANNLVLDDSNEVADIFLYDQQTHQLKRVSLSHDLQESNGSSFNPVISADGRYIAFDSDATNLVSDDTNQATDVFVYDTQTTILTRVSMNHEGIEGNANSLAPTISATGHLIAFESIATNLVSNDNGMDSNIFLYTMEAGQLQKVTQGLDGQPSGSGSFNAFLSEEYLVFDATNLVASDNNNTSDVFRYEIATQEIQRISTQQNSHSLLPTLSPEGQYLVFQSSINGRVHPTKISPTLEAINISESSPLVTPAAISRDGCYTAYTAMTQDSTQLNLFIDQTVQQVAQFDFVTGILNLPTVYVPTLGVFNAQLRLLPQEGRLIFGLEQASPVTTANITCSAFSLSSGLLHLPVVEVSGLTEETLKYQVTMTWITDSDPLQFELFSYYE